MAAHGQRGGTSGGSAVSLLHCGAQLPEDSCMNDHEAHAISTQSKQAWIHAEMLLIDVAFTTIRWLTLKCLTI